MNRAIRSKIAREWLAHVRHTFPDTQNLHPRIDLLLGSGKPCVALIPWKLSRETLKPALETLLDSCNKPWARALGKRNLTKDVLVTHGMKFSGLISHESTVIYTVPSPRLLDYDVVELCGEHATSARATSHVHVYVRANSDEDWPCTSGYPELRITLSPHNVLETDSGLVTTMQSTREFPLLASTLAQKLSRSQSLLYESVATTARQVVEDEYRKLCSWQDVLKLRAQWTQQAHFDLQQNLESSLQQWRKRTVPLYKIIFSFDQVQELAAEFVSKNFLVQSQRSFVYLCGRLDSLSGSNSMDKAIPDPFTSYKEQLISVHAAKLLKEASATALLAFVGIVPCAVIPLAAIYLTDLSVSWMGAITALGVALCISRAQRSWLAATNQFTNQVLQFARESIAACESLSAVRCGYRSSNVDKMEELIRRMPSSEELTE